MNLRLQILLICVGILFSEDSFHGLNFFFLLVDYLDQLFDIGRIVEGCHLRYFFSNILQIYMLKQFEENHDQNIHQGLFINLEVTLLFLSSIECLFFLFFLRESHEVVLFSVRNIFEEFLIFNGDFLYSFYSSYYSDYYRSSIYSAILFSSSCFNSASYPSKYFCPSCLQQNLPFQMRLHRQRWWMKWPQLSFRRKAFCLSEHIRHQSYSTLMSSFLHQIIFQRVFLLKQQGKVAARKLESLLEFLSLTLISPWSLSNFFFIFRSSHSLHFFSGPYLQMKLCLMCLPNRKQFSQRVTSSQCTHLQTVSLAPISLSWQPSQQQLYSLPTFLLMSCYLSMYYFYLIQRMISGVFSSLHRGHLTTPLFFIQCLAHWLKQSKWKVFLQTVAHDVVASHLTICIWHMAQRLSSSSSSSSRITLRRGIFILVYLRKSSTLLSWILLLAMIYLSSLSSYLWRKMSGWSSGMQKISVRAYSVWIQ